MKKYFEEATIEVLKLESVEDITVGGPTINIGTGGGDDNEEFD